MVHLRATLQLVGIPLGCVCRLLTIDQKFEILEVDFVISSDRVCLLRAWCMGEVFFTVVVSGQGSDVAVERVPGGLGGDDFGRPRHFLGVWTVIHSASVLSWLGSSIQAVGGSSPDAVGGFVGILLMVAVGKF